MATIIRTNEEFARFRMFNTQDNHVILVADFDDGVAKVVYTSDHTPESMARVIAGCFEKNSNVKEIILKEYNCSDADCFKGIELSVFGKSLCVTEHNADRNKISKFIKSAIDEFIEDFQKKCDKEFNRIQRIFEDVVTAFDTQQVKFNSTQSEMEWTRWCRYMAQEENGGLISLAGETFAKYVQFLITERGVPEWSAFDEGYEAVKLYTCVNGAMLQRAFDILITCWQHGGRLSMWNDDKTRKELEDFLNQS